MTGYGLYKVGKNAQQKAHKDFFNNAQEQFNHFQGSQAPHKKEGPELKKVYNHLLKKQIQKAYEAQCTAKGETPSAKGLKAYTKEHSGSSAPQIDLNDLRTYIAEKLLVHDTTMALDIIIDQLIDENKHLLDQFPQNSDQPMSYDRKDSDPVLLHKLVQGLNREQDSTYFFLHQAGCKDEFILALIQSPESDRTQAIEVLKNVMGI